MYQVQRKRIIKSHKSMFVFLCFIESAKLSKKKRDSNNFLHFYIAQSYEYLDLMQVNSTSDYTAVVVGVVVLVLLLICGAFSLAFFRFKKRNPGETQWEIVSRNPDYLDTVSIFFYLS